MLEQCVNTIVSNFYFLFFEGKGVGADKCLLLRHISDKKYRILWCITRTFGTKSTVARYAPCMFEHTAKELRFLY